MRDERPQQSGVPRSPHSASPITAPGTGSAARHQARYNADGSPPPCRTTYRAQARTTPDRSPRNPSARSTRPAARNAVTPLARARGFRAPSNGSSTSSWPPVFATAASAASAHRFCTRVSVSRAAARASWAGRGGPPRRRDDGRSGVRHGRGGRREGRTARGRRPQNSADQLDGEGAPPPRRPKSRTSGASATAVSVSTASRSNSRARSRTCPTQSAHRTTTNGSNARYPTAC